MRFSSRGRPSPTIIVAVVALSFALIGTAVAGPDALTRAITKSKVKKIAKKQANKAIDKAEPDLNVNSAKTAETLDGVSVQRLFTQVPAGGAAVDVFSLGGVRLTFGCVGGNPQATAVSQVDNSAITFRNIAGTAGTADLDAGQGQNLSGSSLDFVEFEFVTPGGAGATASLRIDNAPSLGAGACTLSGSVIAE